MFRQLLRVLGGPGSGNHGHAGRPGQRGGSAKGGSGATPKRRPSVFGRPWEVSKHKMLSSSKTHSLFDHSSSSSELKAKAASRLTRRLSAHKESFRRLLEEMNLKYPSTKNVEENPVTDEEIEKLVETLIRSWARSSADHNPLSLAAQKAAAVEFGIDPKPIDVWISSNMAKMFSLTDAQNLQRGIARYSAPEAQAGLRLFLRAQYDETQEFLKEKGIEEVTVFRGFKPPTEIYGEDELDHRAHGIVGADVKVVQNPMSSWSATFDVARHFATSNGLLLASTFKREDILGMPGHGYGCQDEEEFVVRGGLFNATIVSAKSYDRLAATLAPSQLLIAAPDEVFDAFVREETQHTSVQKQNEEKEPLYLDSSDENADWVLREEEHTEEVKPSVTNEPVEKKVKRVKINAFEDPALLMAAVVLSVYRPLKVQGSETSGNHGHAGRPGQRGGSAKRGEAGGSGAGDDVAKAPSPREVWSSKVSSAYETWAKARQAWKEVDDMKEALYKAWKAAGGAHKGPEYEAWSAKVTNEKAPETKALEAATKALCLAMADAPEDVSFSKNNPSQTEMLLGYDSFDPFRVKDIREGVIDDWIESGDSQVYLQDVADDVYGRDVRDDWARIAVAEVDAATPVRWGGRVRVDSTGFHEVVRAFETADVEFFAETGAPKEVVALREKIAENEKIDWSEKYRLKHEEGRFVDEETKELQAQLFELARARAAVIVAERVRASISERLDSFYDPSRLNRDAQVSHFMAVKKEAEESLPGGEVKVFRGIKLSAGMVNHIRQHIAENGSYDMPVPPVQSYTRKENFAEQFAKFGQSGRRGGLTARDKERSVHGMVISATVPAKDVWMHDRQPQWKSFMKKAWADGLTFNIGGKDQKEVVVGHPEPTLRITKENMKWV